MPTVGTIVVLEKTGRFMPYPDLSWQTFRPAEGFYTSEVQHPRRLPVRTFLPTGYEPRYPYPLLVFFHGRGGNEEQILHLAPRLSRRNYICISLRGPQELGARDDVLLLYTAGLNVELHTYAATHRLHPDMLRDINRWMISQCYEE